MQILVVSDAWFPQVNGVVRTLDALRGQLESLGHRSIFFTPDRFFTLPCPSYPEIRLALPKPGDIDRLIDEFRPSAIHIATEGPLGLTARWCCLRRGLPFTTSFHTRFPEYVHARWTVPLSWTYAWLRWFHAAASCIMVSTQSVETALRARGFDRMKRWSRGVDTRLFRPRGKEYFDYSRPVSLYVGRVAVEKSVEDFLRLDLPGTKVVVGDGPQLPMLRHRYPETMFVGTKTGEDLACHYAAADVLVFPSRTDTFGLVLLEALASGVPVAAYPVPGPLDVVDRSGVGCLDWDLAAAVRGALLVSPEVCRRHAEMFSWENSARQFLANMHVFR
jgi:1,2-diacylglycerol 3-alpha-glucosyltransferase/glucuronosyltransferase